MAESISSSRMRANDTAVALLKAINRRDHGEILRLVALNRHSTYTPTRIIRTCAQLSARFGRLDEVLREADAVSVGYRGKGRGEKNAFEFAMEVDGEGRISDFRFDLDLTARIPVGHVEIAAVAGHLTGEMGMLVSSDGIPSISMALVANGSLVWSGAVGVGNVAKSVEADAETVYKTGSILKVLVATAAMQLVEQNVVGLDTPVNEVLPHFQIPNPFENQRPLTLRHLLSHRGGLAPVAPQMVRRWERDFPISLEEVVRTQANVVSVPGEREEYSNLGYAVVGYMVGVLTDMTFDRTMKERLFAPAGMNRTAFELLPSLMENVAVPYEYQASEAVGLGTAPLAVVPAESLRADRYPAGDALSTPADFATFLGMYLSDADQNDRKLLSRKAKNEMNRIQYPGEAGAKSGRGLAWSVDQRAQRHIVRHEGGLPGYSSFMAADLSSRCGVVVFANHSGSVIGSPLPALAEGVALRLLARCSFE